MSETPETSPFLPAPNPADADDARVFHIVLVEPEIPPNTGAVARLCGATNSVLPWASAPTTDI